MNIKRRSVYVEGIELNVILDDVLLNVVVAIGSYVIAIVYPLIPYSENVLDDDQLLLAIVISI